MERKRWISTVLSVCLIGGLAAGCGRAPQAVQQPAQEPPAAASQAQEQGAEGSVTVYAGSMLPGTAVGACEEAEFIKPYGLCPGPGGGLLVVDCYTNQLRLIQDGQVSGLAGNVDTLDQGEYPLGGYLDGEAGKAYLNRPRFAAVSTEGMVVFSDTGNHRVRVVSEGSVRLLAGDGTPGFRDGSYDSAQFDTPSGVAIDTDGTVYVADTLNHCIRMISPQGLVTTLAGVPQKEGFLDGPLETALFCEPNDIQLGPEGSLYVVDKGNQRIRRIKDGVVSTVAGSGDEKDAATGYILGGYKDGKAGQAQFQYPTGLWVTGEGAVYVADTGNNCIRLVSPQGEVSTVAGTKMSGNVSGPLNKARFNQPIDIYQDSGGLYVSDSYNHVIRLIGPDNAQEGGAGS